MRLAVSIIIMVFIVSAISSSLTIRAVFEEALEDDEIRTEQSLEHMVRMLDNLFSDIETVTETASRYAESEISTSESCYDFLRQFMLADTDIIGSSLMFRPYFFPEKGEEFAPSVYCKDGELTNYNPVDYGFTYLEDEKELNWKAGAEGKTCWCTPYYSVQSRSLRNEMRVAYSVPLYDESGFYGILCPAIRLDNLGSIFERYRPYDRCEIRVVDNISGIYVLNPDSAKILNKSIYDEALVLDDAGLTEITECVRDGREGQFVIHRNGEWKVNVYPFERAGWSVLISYPMEIVYGEPRRIALLMMVVSVVTLLVLFCVIAAVIFRILVPYTDKVSKMAEDSASLSRDLQIAYEMQQGMLPKSSALGKCDALDIHGRLLPARDVGGDLYDYFFSNGKFYFCIGDVSGKGVPASLFMVGIRTLLHNIVCSEDRVERIMQELNVNMFRDNSNCMFCTMFLAAVDVKTGKLEYCNAGHNPPVLLRKTGSAEFVASNPDDVIGLFQDSVYHSSELRLCHGDGLFLYTDGVTEAVDSDCRLFGCESLLKVLADVSECKSQTVVESVLETVKTFSGGTEQSDDITMLMLKYFGPVRPD